MPENVQTKMDNVKNEYCVVCRDPRGILKECKACNQGFHVCSWEPCPQARCENCKAVAKV